MRRIRPEDLDLREFIRPGDRIVWGQATGEPLTLTEALVAQLKLTIARLRQDKIIV